MRIFSFYLGAIFGFTVAWIVADALIRREVEPPRQIHYDPITRIRTVT